MTIKNVLLVLVIFVSTLSISAYYTYNVNQNQEMKLELVEYLSEANLSSKSPQRITMSYLVNSNHEVVVLSASSKDFENQIKNTLNYKSIKTQDFEINKIYILPFIIHENGISMM